MVESECRSPDMETSDLFLIDFGMSKHYIDYKGDHK